MSCYHLSRLLFDLKMNESCYQRALTDFEGAIGDYELTDEEKDALRAGTRASYESWASMGCFACISND